MYFYGFLMCVELGIYLFKDVLYLIKSIIVLFNSFLNKCLLNNCISVMSVVI